MLQYKIEKSIPQTDKKLNRGVIAELSYCRHFGICRTKHDNVAYDKDSDLNLNNKHISIKASGFSLMSGNLCEGREDFDGIWALYESRVHSNRFVYITADFTVYEMDLNEFKKFIYTFGYLSRESSHNGGKRKIQARKESKKMLNWFATQVA